MSKDKKINKSNSTSSSSNSEYAHQSKDGRIRGKSITSKHVITGQSYTKHFNSSGEEIYKSYQVEEGNNEHIKHYNSEGNYIGQSLVEETLSGSKYIQHYDAIGNRIGRTYEVETVLGNSIEHSGDAFGYSELNKAKEQQDTDKVTVSGPSGGGSATSTGLGFDVSFGENGGIALLGFIAVLIFFIWLGFGNVSRAINKTYIDPRIFGNS